jgi:hypothetical protein
LDVLYATVIAKTLNTDIFNRNGYPALIMAFLLHDDVLIIEAALHLVGALIECGRFIIPLSISFFVDLITEKSDFPKIRELSFMNACHFMRASPNLALEWLEAGFSAPFFSAVTGFSFDEKKGFGSFLVAVIEAMEDLDRVHEVPLEILSFIVDLLVCDGCTREGLMALVRFLSGVSKGMGDGNVLQRLEELELKCPLRTHLTALLENEDEETRVISETILGFFEYGNN